MSFAEKNPAFHTTIHARHFSLEARASSFSDFICLSIDTGNSDVSFIIAPEAAKEAAQFLRNAAATLDTIEIKNEA